MQLTWRVSYIYMRMYVHAKPYTRYWYIVHLFLSVCLSFSCWSFHLRFVCFRLCFTSFRRYYLCKTFLLNPSKCCCCQRKALVYVYAMPLHQHCPSIHSTGKPTVYTRNENNNGINYPWHPCLLYQRTNEWLNESIHPSMVRPSIQCSNKNMSIDYICKLNFNYFVKLLHGPNEQCNNSDVSRILGHKLSDTPTRTNLLLHRISKLKVRMHLFLAEFKIIIFYFHMHMHTTTMESAYVCSATYFAICTFIPIISS